jgi:phenylalanyl-tRNA synthetase beta chain
MAAIESAVPGTLLRSAVLFDVYRPKAAKPGEESTPSAGVAAGEKSLAVRLTLGSGDASLTEAEIEAAVQAVVAQLVARTGGRLRV